MPAYHFLGKNTQVEVRFHPFHPMNYHDLLICISCFTCAYHPLDAYVRGVYLFGKFLHSLSGVFICIWIHIGLYSRKWD